jgi:hypothetical protein
MNSSIQFLVNLEFYLILNSQIGPNRVIVTFILSNYKGYQSYPIIFIEIAIVSNCLISDPIKYINFSM